MPFAAVAGGVASAATSSLLGGGGGSGSTDPSVSDPFYSQRMGYQDLLQALMGYHGRDSTAALENSPGYKFNLNQGLQAVQGSAAAQGMLGSGNVLTALQTQGAGIASQQYWNEFNALAQLAGANIGSPGTAGQIQAGLAGQTAAGNAALGNAVGGIVQQGVNSYFGNSSTFGGSVSPNAFGYGVPSNTGASYYSGGGDTYGFGGGGNTYGFQA